MNVSNKLAHLDSVYADRSVSVPERFAKRLSNMARKMVEAEGLTVASFDAFVTSIPLNDSTFKTEFRALVVQYDV